MKTKEELNALKEEVETLNRKLAELTEEELIQVTGGTGAPELWNDGRYRVQCDRCGAWLYGKFGEDCMNRLCRHQNGECTIMVL